jgi:uncharacterized repeat protein (TIGR01451 family)
MTKLLPLFIYCFIFNCIFAFAQDLDTTLWVTNAKVQTITASNHTTYLAGDFTYIGPNTGSGVLVNTFTNKLETTPFQQINGWVRAIIPDGNGGWYLGGDFTKVQGVSRNRIAHILADNTLDLNWAPSVDSSVLALSLVDNLLYIGGRFSAIDGQNRKYLAAISTASGQVTSWNPNANGPIHALTNAEDILYAGGEFTSIYGNIRNRVAAFDLSTQELTTWSPNVDNVVRALVVHQGLLYIGGFFTNINTQSRNYLAAINTLDGQVSGWNPNPDREVHALFLANHTLYVGGRFGNISGQSTKIAAAIDLLSGTVTNWNAHLNWNGTVYAISVSNNTIYLGGTFISGSDALGTDGFRSSVKALIAINATTNQLVEDDLNVESNHIVYGLSSWQNNLFIGGTFKSLGGQYRYRLAAIDAITKEVLPWDPQTTGSVNQLVYYNNLIYAGGWFSIIGGKKRLGVACLDPITGHATEWNPYANDSRTSMTEVQVTTIAASNNTIYVGEYAKPSSLFNAFHATTGALLWRHRIENSFFNDIAATESQVFVGGGFTTVGGKSRNNLVAFDTRNGSITDWNPNANKAVSALTIVNDSIYIGGFFETIAGQSRIKFACVDTLTGQVSLWNPGVNGTIYDIAIENDLAYIGGNFTQIGGKPRNHLAVINIFTKDILDWNPSVNNQVRCLSIQDGAIYTGGLYTQVGQKIVPYFASFGKRLTIPKLNYIKGNIYVDQNSNCTKDELEATMKDIIVKAEPGPYYAITDEKGNYRMAVDTGSFTLKQMLPEGIKVKLVNQLCPANEKSHTVSFTSYNNTIQDLNFGNYITLCPFLNVQIASDRRRRCFRGTTTITYTNTGSGSASDVKVHVKFPSYVIPIKADKAYTLTSDSVYIFDIGTLDASRSGRISITDSVICGISSIRGLTQCTKVWITPANSCLPPNPQWDKSDISLQATCRDNGFVRMNIYNKGVGHMADSSSFRIFLDAKLIFKHPYKLLAGDSLILQVPANGQTVRIEADQHSYHPTERISTLTIEACGKDASGKVSRGFVTQLPVASEAPEQAIECLPIIDSFDPNDKAVVPQGMTENYYTPMGKALEYTIRFQNTGTDTAYKVVVVDTLSANLNMSTLQLGTVSHPYTLSVSGKGKPVLTFTFNNINLPDSTSDQLGSNGYIKFSIKPKEGLAEKTIIKNYADIFFDYNEPVRTNTVFNTIYDMPLVVEESLRLDKAIICNPMNTSISAGTNQVICEQEILLQAVSPLHGQGSWELVRGAGIIEDRHSAHSSIKGLAYGENVFEWKIPANTCTDSLKAQVTITRHAKPITPIITQLGSDSLLCSINAAEYEWRLDGNKLENTSRSIYVNQTGSYTVSVTNSMGCISEESAAFSYVLTAIDHYLSSLVTIYPNPSIGRFIISIPVSLGPDVEVSLVDAIGRTIHTSRITVNPNEDYQQHIDLSSIETGVYVIKLQTSKGVIVKRLVKQ